MSTQNTTIKFPFTDRASYLLWAADWKARYAQHTTLTIALKRDIKEAQRKPDTAKASRLQYSLFSSKREARALIDERHLSKVEAQRQYMAVAFERKAA